MEIFQEQLSKLFECLDKKIFSNKTVRNKFVFSVELYCPYFFQIEVNRFLCFQTINTTKSPLSNSKSGSYWHFKLILPIEQYESIEQEHEVHL